MRISDWSSDVCSSDLTTGKASSASLVRGNAAGELARKALISSIAWARVSCTEQKLVTQICICEGSRPTDLAASRKSAICCASLSSCLAPERSEEHTSELQSLMRSSYAVFCLKNK